MKGLDIAALDGRTRALADLGCCAMYRQSLQQHLTSAKRKHWSAGLIDHSVRDARAVGWIIEHLAARMRCHPSRLARRRHLWLLPQWPRNYYHEPERDQRRVYLGRLGPETLRVADYATEILFGRTLEQYVAYLVSSGRPLICKELGALIKIGRRAERDALHRFDDSVSDGCGLETNGHGG